MLNELAAALEEVRVQFENVLAASSNRSDDGVVKDVVARCVFRELESIANAIGGQDLRYTIRSLSGPATIAELGQHFPDLLSDE